MISLFKVTRDGEAQDFSVLDDRQFLAVSLLCLIDLKSVQSSLHLSALRSNRG